MCVSECVCESVCVCMCEACPSVLCSPESNERPAAVHGLLTQERDGALQAGPVSAFL
jgi:hypothetical protein